MQEKREGRLRGCPDTTIPAGSFQLGLGQLLKKPKGTGLTETPNGLPAVARYISKTESSPSRKDGILLGGKLWMTRSWLRFLLLRE